MNINPLRDVVVAIKEKSELKTESGLLLAPTVKDEDTSLRVVAVGKLVKEVKVGDRIVTKHASATSAKVEFGGEDYLLLEEEDVIGIVQ